MSNKGRTIRSFDGNPSEPTPLPAETPFSLGADSPHRHRYGLVPVWLADSSAVESWWWCTDHPAGEWAKIEDDPDAAYAIPARQDSPDLRDVVFDVDGVISNGQRPNVTVNGESRFVGRPGIRDLFDVLGCLGFRVVVWSAGGAKYAREVCEALNVHGSVREYADKPPYPMTEEEAEINLGRRPVLQIDDDPTERVADWPFMVLPTFAAAPDPGRTGPPSGTGSDPGQPGAQAVTLGVMVVALRHPCSYPGDPCDRHRGDKTYTRCDCCVLRDLAQAHRETVPRPLVTSQRVAPDSPEGEP
jgi:hypothetical protein